MKIKEIYLKKTYAFNWIVKNHYISIIMSYTQLSCFKFFWCLSKLTLFTKLVLTMVYLTPSSSNRLDNLSKADVIYVQRIVLSQKSSEQYIFLNGIAYFVGDQSLLDQLVVI